MDRFLLNQKYFRAACVVCGLSVCVKENVDVLALDAASAILRSVDNAVDHHLSAQGNHLGIDGNGVVCGCDGS